MAYDATACDRCIRGKSWVASLTNLAFLPMRWPRPWPYPTNRITAILKGQRGVTADTALRLSLLLRHDAAVLAEPSEDL